MKVRELVALLVRFDPEDIVLINPDTQCLLLLNRRPGMSEPLSQDGCEFELTELDKKLLRDMQVRF
jgi:hypothetical protein